jgi:hypothetical protein
MSNDQYPSKYDFFVYIVESPSAPDIYQGRCEGGILAQALRLDSIPCVTRTAINLEAFSAALSIGFPEVMKQFPGRYPILHLSAHGNADGIQLSSGETVAWGQLRQQLIPINESLNGTLLLCMSACEGYAAMQMAMELEESNPHPYFAMVGNYEKPSWSDTTVAFLVFYHLVVKNKSMLEALEAMKIASGSQNWTLQTAEKIKQSYIDFVKGRVQPAEAQQELESAAQGQEIPPTAKALEKK